MIKRKAMLTEPVPRRINTMDMAMGWVDRFGRLTAEGRAAAREYPELLRQYPEDKNHD